MADRHSLLRELDDARAMLLAAMEGIPEADWAGPLPGCSWTVADVLHHITAWDEVGAATVEAMVSGASVDMYVDDVDAWNDQVVSTRKGNSPETTLSDLHQARERLRSALLTAPPPLWEQTHLSPQDHPISIPGICRTWINHDTEHAAELRAVRDRDPGSGPQTS